jgi:hypothetical protein
VRGELSPPSRCHGLWQTVARRQFLGTAELFECGVALFWRNRKRKRKRQQGHPHSLIEIAIVWPRAFALTPRSLGL